MDQVIPEENGSPDVVMIIIGVVLFVSVILYIKRNADQWKDLSKVVNLFLFLLSNSVFTTVSILMMEVKKGKTFPTYNLFILNMFIVMFKQIGIMTLHKTFAAVSPRTSLIFSPLVNLALICLYVVNQSSDYLQSIDVIGLLFKGIHIEDPKLALLVLIALMVDFIANIIRLVLIYVKSSDSEYIESVCSKTQLTKECMSIIDSDYIMYVTFVGYVLIYIYTVWYFK